jgi:hypothetical protein
MPNVFRWARTVRPFIASYAVLTLVAAGSLSLVAQQAGAQVPRDDPARGLIYQGLRRGHPQGPCRGKFELPDRAADGSARTACTHGPDPAPPGVDVRVSVEPVSPAEAALAAEPGIPCIGTGSDAFRVHVIYARPTNAPDRYSQYASSFVSWVAGVDSIVNASAGESGRSQHVRFLTTSSCNLVIDRITISSSAANDMGTMIQELRNQGYNRTDRKYLVFADASRYCGIGQYYDDDRPTTTPGFNHSNGHSSVPGTVGRVDSGCWGSNTPAHEMMHGLGAVMDSAPHATGEAHCTDEYDRMCYDDEGPRGISIVCPDSSHESRFDCNHDDYYSAGPPPPGSYLANHWNTANSAFLTPVDAVAAPPNDQFESGQAIAGIQGRVQGATTTGATKQSGEPNHAGNAGGASVWYRWTAPETARVTFNTLGSTFDTLLAVYTGTSVSGLSAVAGDDDAPSGGVTSRVGFRAVAGTPYHIAVDGWNGETGTFALNWHRADPLLAADFDGDGDTDPSVFRPASGTWYAPNRTPVAVFWGASGDIPVPGDYDGDGGTNEAVFRPGSGVWYIHDGNPGTVAWGTSGDIPVPGDYDGDGDTDVAVFRPGSGAWFISGGNPDTVYWGANGDIPVPGDYDGDGDTDVAVFRPATGTWHVREGNPDAVIWGTNGDIPVPADYDGNRTTDIAVFRAGTWYVRGGAPEAVPWGTSGDRPEPGDYDGNGRADIAVFRPASGTWYVRAAGPESTVWGDSTDIALPLPASIRAALP